MPVDDLSYGEGHFNFAFKDGSVLKLMPDGHFERVLGQDHECVQSQVSQTQAQPVPQLEAKPQFGDSEEAHILSVLFGIVTTTHVAFKGLLALRRERNRSIEARQINRSSFEIPIEKRIE